SPAGGDREGAIAPLLWCHLRPTTHDGQIILLAKALDHCRAANLLKIIEQGWFKLNPMAIGVDHGMREARMDRGRCSFVSRVHSQPSSFVECEPAAVTWLAPVLPLRHLGDQG